MSSSSNFRDRLERKRRVLRLNRMLRKQRLENSRQFAILGITSIVFCILFFVTPYILRITSDVHTEKITVSTTDNQFQGETKEIELNKGGLYKFIIKPKATSKYKDASVEQGLYIELINEEGERVYSFKHFYEKAGITSNNDIQYDIPIYINVNKAGKHKLKIYAPTVPFAEFNVKVSKRVAGDLYFGYYRWITLAIVILLLVSSAKFGTYQEWIAAIERKRVSFKNYQTLIALLIVVVYLGCIVIAFMHYGYAGFGNYNHAPTSWFSDGYVYYLGP